MLAQFKEHINSHFPQLKKIKFLLACSGGVDSVVLAHLCFSLNLDFAIAHCNFQLRKEESDKDEKFVKNLSNSLSKGFHLIHFKTKEYAASHKVSIQVAARELRYQWFTNIQDKNSIPILVTAHHADDDLETFLINLSRGSGIDGLKGIPSNNATISRPLLAFSRNQIEDYAKANNIEWREDKSNTDTKYLRNKIRHEIVPLLKELHPTFLENFKNTQEYLYQTASITSNSINKLKELLFVLEDGTFKIEINELRKLEPIEAYLHGLFKNYGFTEWNNVLDLLTANSGKEVRSKTHRLVKDRNHLLLEELKTKIAERFTITKNITQLKTPFQLKITNVSCIEETSSHTLYVDKKTLKYPLVLRKWEKGDYFYPIGMRGRKKLSKFFKDEKIDIIAKEKQWLLCSENEIVWVIGKRADDRFKIKKDTTDILKFEVTL